MPISNDIGTPTVHRKPATALPRTLTPVGRSATCAVRDQSCCSALATEPGTISHSTGPWRCLHGAMLRQALDIGDGPGGTHLTMRWQGCWRWHWCCSCRWPRRPPFGRAQQLRRRTTRSPCCSIRGTRLFLACHQRRRTRCRCPCKCERRCDAVPARPKSGALARGFNHRWILLPHGRGRRPRCGAPPSVTRRTGVFGRTLAF